jgi:hypothetical protein
VDTFERSTVSWRDGLLDCCLGVCVRVRVHVHVHVRARVCDVCILATSVSFLVSCICPSQVKTFHDAEAKVIGHDSGKGRLGSRLGALECQLPSGKTFRVGSGFSDADRVCAESLALLPVLTSRKRFL